MLHVKQEAQVRELSLAKTSSALARNGSLAASRAVGERAQRRDARLRIDGFGFLPNRD